MGVRDTGRRKPAGVVDAFQAKDGFFIVQCVRDHQLRALANAIGHPEWLADPRLADRYGRRRRAFADVDQAADDIAHHVMQEGVGGQVEKQRVSTLADIHPGQPFDR